MDPIHTVFLSIRLSLARVISRIVPPRDVEDVVQETYVRLCQVDEPAKIQNPKSYLFKTARNLALDVVKRAENRLMESASESMLDGITNAYGDKDEPFEKVASSEEFGYFCEAVRALPKQARRVFVLKKVYGYSQQEISRELSIAESTVEKHVALAIRRCSLFMQQRYNTEAKTHRFQTLAKLVIKEDVE